MFRVAYGSNSWLFEDVVTKQKVTSSLSIHWCNTTQLFPPFHLSLSFNLGYYLIGWCKECEEETRGGDERNHFMLRKHVIQSLLSCVLLESDMSGVSDFITRHPSIRSLMNPWESWTTILPEDNIRCHGNISKWSLKAGDSDHLIPRGMGTVRMESSVSGWASGVWPKRFITRLPHVPSYGVAESRSLSNYWKWVQ